MPLACEEHGEEHGAKPRGGQRTAPGAQKHRMPKALDAHLGNGRVGVGERHAPAAADVNHVECARLFVLAVFREEHRACPRVRQARMRGIRRSERRGEVGSLIVGRF